VAVSRFWKGVARKPAPPTPREIKWDDTNIESDATDNETETEPLACQRPRAMACCAELWDRRPVFTESEPKSDPERKALKKSLRQLVLFKELLEDELKAVVETASIRAFDGGERIVKHGDPGNELFVVISGAVNAYDEHQLLETKLGGVEGNSRVGKSAQRCPACKPKRTITQGEFFGESNILWRSPWPLSFMLIQAAQPFSAGLIGLPRKLSFSKTR
jgi:hypothetical protein